MNGSSVRSRRSGVTAMRLAVERGEVAAQRCAGDAAAAEGDPVIGIAAAVVARIDVQQFLVALALAGDGDARRPRPARNPGN